MVASIIARSYGDGSNVKLSLRIATPDIKNAIALGIELSKARWELVNDTLKQLAKASKRGASFFVEDNIATKLWKLITSIDLKYNAGKLSLQSAKMVIEEALHQEVAEERQRNDVEQKKKMTLKEWIKEYIRQCEDGERLKRRSTKMITLGTIKSYKGTLSQLEAYEAACHKVIDFNDVTIDFYDSWKAFFIKKMYSPNTIGRHVKNLKSFLFAAEDMKLTTCEDFKSERFSVDHEDVDNVYLTEERIEQMYNFDPTDEQQIISCINALPKEDRRRLRELTDRAQSRKALSQVKDVFLVGCLTGQRVSDYKRINESMIVTLRDGRKYLDLTQEKTSKPIYIPLDERVMAILQKYDGKLPKVYDQKINMRIKIIGHLLGWTEDAGVRELHGTMAVDNGKKFYECIKTHTARRTFATNAYKNGVALSSIMAVTGHSSEAMLRKYLKLDNKERAIIAAQEFEKARRIKLKIAK